MRSPASPSERPHSSLNLASHAFKDDRFRDDRKLATVLGYETQPTLGTHGAARRPTLDASSERSVRCRWESWLGL